jgi:4-hydroxythreonine-4-phosphate dehydrogenase
LEERARQLDISVNINSLQSLNDPLDTHVEGRLNVLSVPLEEHAVAGTLNSKNAEYVIAQLELAIEACTSHSVDAMVTGPVHKGIINEAGIAFTGHTEFLADKTNTSLPVMMLQTEGLRVALATTHLPLKDVASKLTPELLEQVITILHHDLVTKYGVENPRIMICGLNPHAGEGGYLGEEEITVMEPVIKKLQSNGMNLEGPLSADTIFSENNLKRADAFLAMYHDQGLPVIKYKGFGETVNVTLGLPIIRTSVDHGTALSLAGTGIAEVKSFLQAIKAACELSQSHQ